MFDELRVCLNPLFVCSQTEYPALPDSRAVLTMPMSRVFKQRPCSPAALIDPFKVSPVNIQKPPFGKKRPRQAKKKITKLKIQFALPKGPFPVLVPSLVYVHSGRA